MKRQVTIERLDNNYAYSFHEVGEDDTRHVGSGSRRTWEETMSEAREFLHPRRIPKVGDQVYHVVHTDWVGTVRYVLNDQVCVSLHDFNSLRVFGIEEVIVAD